MTKIYAPVALFPMRMELRQNKNTGGAIISYDVRWYPDTCQVFNPVNPVSEQELEAYAEYASRREPNDADVSRTALSDFIGEVGPERARLILLWKEKGINPDLISDSKTDFEGRTTFKLMPEYVELYVMDAEDNIRNVGRGNRIDQEAVSLTIYDLAAGETWVDHFAKAVELGMGMTVTSAASVNLINNAKWLFAAGVSANSDSRTLIKELFMRKAAAGSFEFLEQDSVIKNAEDEGADYAEAGSATEKLEALLELDGSAVDYSSADILGGLLGFEEGDVRQAFGYIKNASGLDQKNAAHMFQLFDLYFQGTHCAWFRVKIEEPDLPPIDDKEREKPGAHLFWRFDVINDFVSQLTLEQRLLWDTFFRDLANGEQLRNQQEAMAGLRDTQAGRDAQTGRDVQTGRDARAGLQDAQAGLQTGLQDMQAGRDAQAGLQAGLRDMQAGLQGAQAGVRQAMNTVGAGLMSLSGAQAESFVPYTPLVYEEMLNSIHMTKNYVSGRGPAPAVLIDGTAYGVLPVGLMENLLEAIGDFATDNTEKSNLIRLALNSGCPMGQLFETPWDPGEELDTKLTINGKNINRIPENDYGTLAEIGGKLDTTSRLLPVPGRVYASDDRDGDGQLVSKPLIREGDLELARTWANEAIRFIETHNYSAPFRRVDFPEFPVIDFGEESVFTLTVKANLHALMEQWEWSEYGNVGKMNPGNIPSQLGNYTKLHARDMKLAIDSLIASGAGLSELETLIIECADLFVSRRDAWESVITLPLFADIDLHRQGKKMKRYTPPGKQTDKRTLSGVYGWLQNPGQSGSTGSTRDYDGFFQAPSVNQTIAAAMLRNAAVVNSDSEPAVYNINLSSNRTEEAVWMVEGLRAGYEWAELLGMRFERLLHERNLDRLLHTLRSRFPLDKARGGSTGSAHLVNGEDILDTDSLGSASGIGGADLIALRQVVEELRVVEDSLADLFISEIAYHLASSNFAGANAWLTAFENHIAPPELNMAHIQRSGRNIRQRAVVPLLCMERLEDLNPRIIAEPALADFTDRMFSGFWPDRGQLFIDVSIYERENEDESPSPVFSRRLSPFDDLGLSPWDLVLGGKSEAESCAARRVLEMMNEREILPPEVLDAKDQAAAFDSLYLTIIEHGPMEAVYDKASQLLTFYKGSTPLTLGDVSRSDLEDGEITEAGVISAKALYARLSSLVSYYNDVFGDLLSCFNRPGQSAATGMGLQSGLAKEFGIGSRVKVERSDAQLAADNAGGINTESSIKGKVESNRVIATELVEALKPPGFRPPAGGDGDTQQNVVGLSKEDAEKIGACLETLYKFGFEAAGRALLYGYPRNGDTCDRENYFIELASLIESFMERDGASALEEALTFITPNDEVLIFRPGDGGFTCPEGFLMTEGMYSLALEEIVSQLRQALCDWTAKKVMPILPPFIVPEKRRFVVSGRPASDMLAKYTKVLPRVAAASAATNGFSDEIFTSVFEAGLIKSFEEIKAEVLAGIAGEGDAPEIDADKPDGRSQTDVYFIMEKDAAENAVQYFSAAEACAGLIADEWTEYMHGQSEVTGIGYKNQTAKSKAPNCILLATVFDKEPTGELMAKHLKETIRLMRLRSDGAEFLATTQGAYGALNYFYGEDCNLSSSYFVDQP